MASVNKVILVGNLGADPEVRYAPSGDAFCNVSIATTDKWTDKTSGEKKEATEWHRVTFSGKLAEVVGKYLKKGSAVYVEGSLRTRKWQDKEGRDQYTTEIRADQMQMLGSKQASDGGLPDDKQAAAPQKAARRPTPQPAPIPAPSGLGDFDDDIPF